jgi:tellurite resistance protein TerC
MNISKEFDGSKFRTNTNGVKKFTPLFLVVIVLASTDIVFAVDSIPTIFGITQDVFIVWTSNMMAVIGMRPLYFLLQEIKDKFRFLKYGLSLILVFIGLKMSSTYISHWVGEMINNKTLSDFHINTFTSLGIIVGVVTGSIILSNVIPEKNEPEIKK